MRLAVAPLAAFLLIQACVSAPPKPPRSGLHDVDVAPRPRHIVQAEYPESATPWRDGKVVLEVTIDAEGYVSKTEVRDSTDPVFEEPAREAVAQWIFEPALFNGKAVASMIIVPMEFRPMD